MGTTAIALLSFNRPEYFRKVAESLAISIKEGKRNYDVYLFQDGAFNIDSKRQKCSDNALHENARIFQFLFPNGELCVSPVNLGVALNYARSEDYLFERSNYDSVMFFEDDMILHRYYIPVMEGLLSQAEEDDRIGQVACYGDNHLLARDEQVLSRNDYTGLGNNWGFAVTRRFYQIRKKWDAAYLKVLEGTDYEDKHRAMEAIQRLHVEMDFRPGVISQDMFKSMATTFEGGIRINTKAVLGKYIGEIGLHSNVEGFAEQRFNHTMLYPHDAPVPEPKIDFTRISELLEVQRGAINFMNGFRDE